MTAKSLQLFHKQYTFELQQDVKLERKEQGKESENDTFLLLGQKEYELEERKSGRRASPEGTPQKWDKGGKISEPVDYSREWFSAKTNFCRPIFFFFALLLPFSLTSKNGLKDGS
jgi:hypothetical protein